MDGVWGTDRVMLRDTETDMEATESSDLKPLKVQLRPLTELTRTSLDAGLVEDLRQGQSRKRIFRLWEYLGYRLWLGT